MKSRCWIICDWTGKRLFPDRTWTFFENAWDFLTVQFPEADWEDLYVDSMEVTHANS